MATIKSYTDLEQSKKLAEILPLESADQTWARIAIAGANLDVPEELQYRHNGDMPFQYYSGIGIPCWSLASLLGVLPPYLYEWEKGIDFNLYPSVAKNGWWCAGYISQDLSSENKDKFTLITNADNPVDACYEIILKLNELKKL